MRVGIDLREFTGEDVVVKAQEADELGLWAVLIGGDAGTESTTAAQLATMTEHIHIAMSITAHSAHPHTLAEEIAIVDQLSRRRALAVIAGDPSVTTHVRELLGGHIVDGSVLAPAPAQTAVPVWSASSELFVELTGDLAADSATIDAQRDAGHTHIFVTWPGPTLVLARHLATRAATPGFPQIVADQADIIAPYNDN